MKSPSSNCHLEEQLKSSAEELRRLLIGLPDHEAITDVFDYILGALYGLTKAIELGFVNRAVLWHETYRPHLPQYVERITKDQAVNKRWLAGFYFNSAIQRIAASYDRVPKLIRAEGRSARQRMKAANTGQFAAWDKVYEEINSYKHDTSGRAAGRTVTLEDAVAAFEELVTLLKLSEHKLHSLYAPAVRNH